MFIVLSQKAEELSDYEDKLFRSYHYPSRYAGQIHIGDVFLYYQPDRYNADNRCYFGTGIIGGIQAMEAGDFHANLVEATRFPRTVPIRLSEGSACWYVEELGYSTVRARPYPPWQMSVRPLSSQAYIFILEAAGVPVTAKPSGEKPLCSLDILQDKLKTALKQYYVGHDPEAIYRIECLASILRHSFEEERQPSGSTGHQQQRDL